MKNVQTYTWKGKTLTPKQWAGVLGISVPAFYARLERELPWDKVFSPPMKGFASLSPEGRREMASRGGRIAHALGVAYHWSSEQARIAGSKGGKSKINKTILP